MRQFISRQNVRGWKEKSMTSAVWTVVEVAAAREAADAVEHALLECGAVGTEIDLLGKKNRAEQMLVRGYFDEEALCPDVGEEIRRTLAAFGRPESDLIEIRQGSVENQDWLAEWKKHWKATRVGRFLIAPPWEAVGVDSGIVIRIEPNMAFGTGTHDTTQLCLIAIGELVNSGESFLDVGTGTGILSIAAAKLGANPIVACDTDADSVSIARENAIANSVAGIDFRDGGIDSDGEKFDFVAANLTLDVILPILPILIDKARRVLLLSGILADQREEIEAALDRLGVPDKKIAQSGEWISVVIQRENHLR
jgi:ribosomal protein L11 methyltransferase